MLLTTIGLPQGVFLLSRNNPFAEWGTIITNYGKRATMFENAINSKKQGDIGMCYAIAYFYLLPKQNIHSNTALLLVKEMEKYKVYL